MEGIQSLDGTGTGCSDMDGIQKEKAEFIFNEHGTNRSKGTVVSEVFIIIRVVMLVVVVTGDGQVKCRKMGGVWVPRMIRSHDELGDRGVFKEFIGGRAPCVEV